MEESGSQITKDGRGLFSRKRENRVLFIITVLFLINTTDLVATLIYNKLVKGMESNQLANYLFQHVGDNAVIIYKTTLTAFSLGILYAARRLHVAEKAAWFLFAIFMCLAIYWFIFAMTYANIIPKEIF